MGFGLHLQSCARKNAKLRHLVYFLTRLTEIFPRVLRTLSSHREQIVGLDRQFGRRSVRFQRGVELLR